MHHPWKNNMERYGTSHFYRSVLEFWELDSRMMTGHIMENDTTLIPCKSYKIFILLGIKGGKGILDNKIISIWHK